MDWETDCRPAPTDTDLKGMDMQARQGGRWGLLPILVLVNAAAIWGQAGWASDNLIDEAWDWRLVIAVCAGFAAAIELTGVFLANKADQAEDAGIPAGGIRLGSYGVGIFSGVLNFSHFSQISLAASVAFGFLSAASPFLWGIDSRVRRGRSVAPSRRFWHPVRSVALLRYAAWEGIADEEQALRLMATPRTYQYARPIGPMPAPAAPIPIIAAVITPEQEKPMTSEEIMHSMCTIDQSDDGCLAGLPVAPEITAAITTARRARGAWDARTVIDLAADGCTAAEIVEKVEGISPATAARFTKVARALRADPATVIDSAKEKVSPEYVRIMREAIAR